MLFLPENWSIRPLKDTDYARIAEIDAGIVLSNFSRLSFLREMHNGLAHYEGLEIDGRLVGYAGYWLVAGESHVMRIGLDVRLHGLGLGALLLVSGLGWAVKNGAILMTLEVRRSNVQAQRLYERYGFAYVGERRGYYLDTGEDALLMTLEPIDGGQVGVWEREICEKIGGIGRFPLRPNSNSGV